MSVILNLVHLDLEAFIYHFLVDATKKIDFIPILQVQIVEYHQIQASLDPPELVIKVSLAFQDSLK